MTVYKTLNPHPQVIAKCMENGYLPDPFTVETTEHALLAAIGQARTKELVDPSDNGKNPRHHKLVVETKETAERPIKRTVTKISRVKNPEGEFVYFTEYLEGNTFAGQYVDLSRVVGKYAEPQFNVDIDRASGTKTVTGIRRKDARYEIPFGSINKFTDPSTGEETALDSLPLDVAVRFYAVTNDRKYALPSISMEEFTSKSFEELVEYGKTGKWPAPVLAEVEETSPKTRRGKQD